MVMRRLKLTRDQLAAFLTDPEQIRQFELLFSMVDEMGSSGADSISITIGNVGAQAQDALNTLQSIRDALDREPPFAEDAALGGRVLALEAAPLPAVQTITLTTDVTGSGTGSFAATIANDAVTYAKMQNVSALSRLLGRGDSGAGDPQEIILGTNLTMAGTTLNAAGGAGGDLALNKHVLAANFTVTAGYGALIPRYLEIGATFALEIGADADLEIA